MKKITIHPFMYYLVTIIYLELITKVVITHQFINIGLIYTIIFTLPFILLLTIFTKLFNKTINKILLFISTSVITIYFNVQYIFYSLFSTPFSFRTLSLADQALDFTTIIKDAILSHLPIFASIFIPLLLLIIFHKLVDTSKYHKEVVASLFAMFIISYLSTFLTLIPHFKDNDSPYKLYFKVDNQTSLIDNFGLLTSTKVDIKRILFGYKTELLEESNIYNPVSIESLEPKEEVIVYKDNILDLDLSETTNANINTINNYVINQLPTKQTEYTGMFQGKNLIFILAEGFNEIAVDEFRTPTLYKLVNNGFVFKNFYSPVFLSTTGGEFQATTSLIPTQEILSTWKTKTPKITYALGNAFGTIGYRTQSYHDWTYTYYKRNQTMKTLGFNNYMGCGNGLEKRMNCNWLPQDSEMINVTTSEYLDSPGPFVTYYISVSGHSPYEPGDNIAKLHLDTVADLNYSSAIKYYLAAQVELDKMLENLITNLTNSGKLEDTVIALVGDHYPYTIPVEEINQVSSYYKDGSIEINHSNFILWNSEMEEPIVVDKVGSQIDVLPTILNLFGIEYDSRLLIGKDILNDTECLAIFSNRSWVSDMGTYNASTRQFTLKDGKSFTDESEDSYIRRINNRVANSFTISKLIIENDYYKYILER